MNPSHTTRLRPRDRVSPGPSPLSSPTLNRRSGSLPVASFNDLGGQNEKISRNNESKTTTIDSYNKGKTSECGTLAIKKVYFG